MKTKITHLTSAHQRYDTRIFLKECSSLAKIQEYKVSLVVADGLGFENKNAVDIIDVGAKPGGRLSRMTKTVKKVFEKAKELDSDIYHLHDPELMPIGLKLKKMGKKVIFDIHENTDLQIMEKIWIPLYLRSIISFVYQIYENSVCKKFDLLIVPQEAMYKKYIKFSKVIVIGNFPNEREGKNNYKKIVNRYALLYSGSISEARGLFNMLNLIKELTLLDNRYELTLAGSINKELLDEARNHSAWENTKYLGLLSKEEIDKVYEKHSIGLIIFNNVGQYFMAYSLKLFEYMQNKMLVVMPNFGDWIDFNKKYNVGINVETRNSKDLAKKIDMLNNEEIQSLGYLNMEKVNQHFTWISQEEKLYNVYKKLVGNAYAIK